MIFIDFPMPDRCETCPCAFIQDGGVFGDSCQVTGDELEQEQVERKRPDWCPLKEVKDGN